MLCLQTASTLHRLGQGTARNQPDFYLCSSRGERMALTRACRALLNDGHKIPMVGLGTFAPEGTPKGVVEDAVKVALDVGYRHIDGAYVYANEDEVGRAIKAKIADGTVKREEVFYTTKLWSTFHAPDKVRVGLKKSLEAAGLDYVDLYLIHGPYGLKAGEELFPTDADGKLIFSHTDLRDTWKAMEACKDAGLAKSIGVSNFNHKQLERILTMPGLKYKPACVEVECHLFLNQSKLLAFCKSHDIQLIAYSVLGSTRDKTWVDQNAPVLLEDPALNAIAKKYGRSPANVAMRYMLQREVVVLAKSFKAERIKQNLEVFEFELSTEEMKTLEARNLNSRYSHFDQFKDHPQYPFNEEY